MNKALVVVATIAAIGSLGLGAASPAAAATSFMPPYRVAKGALRVQKGRLVQPFSLQVSPSMISISGRFRCSFYGPKGKPIGATDAQVPPLSPSQAFSGQVSLTYTGDSHATTRCKFIADQ